MSKENIVVQKMRLFVGTQKKGKNKELAKKKTMDKKPRELWIPRVIKCYSHPIENLMHFVR